MSDHSAVHLVAFEHPGLAHSLRGKLIKRKAELTAQLYCSQDWADFKSRVGTLNGLDEAIAVCLELEKTMGD